MKMEVKINASHFSIGIRTIWLQVLFDLLDMIYFIYFSVKLLIQFRVNCDLRECITAVKTHNLNYFSLDQNIIDNVVFWIHVFFP